MDYQIEDWNTIAITPLPPGWRNLYLDEDEPGGALLEDCPAVLLQRHEMTRFYDSEHRLLRTRREPKPRETRALFATYSEMGLEPADQSYNYIVTLGPGDGDDVVAGRVAEARKFEAPKFAQNSPEDESRRREHARTYI